MTKSLQGKHYAGSGRPLGSLRPRSCAVTVGIRNLKAHFIAHSGGFSLGA